MSIWTLTDSVRTRTLEDWAIEAASLQRHRASLATAFQPAIERLEAVLNVRAQCLEVFSA